ncbi:MAG: hypothetical protein KKF48_04975 [Nanoarchaeota archaeon]|nr:hypothetical protein [Nanoarchaeota archaeon]MBU1028370.1 hypothetical protein [Nanoarchaeota archaeon]
MEVKYFSLKPRNKPEINGDVVILKDGQLKTFTGDGYPEDPELKADRYDQVSCSKKYYLERITEKEALRHKQARDKWNCRPLW